MNTHIKLVAIVAMTPDRIIGKPEGGMPWRISEDFEHFKKETMGHPVIMGRKTHNEILQNLKGNPLPGRTIFVVTSKVPEETAPGNLFFCENTAEASMKAQTQAQNTDKDKVLIIGGASIYEAFLPFIEEIILTRIETEVPEGPKFPEFEEDFSQVRIRLKEKRHSLHYQFEWWERSKNHRSL